MEQIEKKLDKIEEKLDKVDSRIDKIDKTLVGQAKQLEHHIYRTTLAEEHLKILQAQVEPLSEFHAKFNGIMKFVGVIATGVTFVLGLVKLFKELV